MIRSQKPSARISLTPLIDVVFILLIFFMATMTLTKIKTVDFELPKTVAKNNNANKKEILTLTVTEKGTVLKNKTFADTESLVGFIKDYNKKVIWGIKPNKTVSTSVFLKLWKDLSNNGVTINIITPKQKKEGK